VAKSGEQTLSPKVATMYTLRATDPAGKVYQATSRVEVRPKPLTTSIQRLQLSRQEIVAGEKVTLSWNVEGPAQVEITPGLGAVAKSGEQTLTPSEDTVYTLRASDSAGKVYEATSRVTVVPKQSPPLIQRFQFSRQEIVAGEKVTLSWNVEGPAKVEIMPGLGAVAKAGEQTLTPSEDTMYTLRATDSAGKVYEARSRVAVRPKPESFVVHHFSVEPQEIRAGQTATLTWQTSGATAVEIQPGIGSVGPSGSRQIAPPPGKTVYTIVARGNPPEKSELRQVQISVGRGGGTIIWEGNIRGSEMVDIDINKASSGQLTGGLPGAPCIIQSVEPQNVRVLIRPSPENRYLKLRLLVIGNGHTRVVVTWAFQ
jgi:ethanolamine utilization microcompartment shell protein EutS